MALYHGLHRWPASGACHSSQSIPAGKDQLPQQIVEQHRLPNKQEVVENANLRPICRLTFRFVTLVSAALVSECGWQNDFGADNIAISEKDGMTEPRLIDRQWTEDLVANSVRLRCIYQRRGKHVLRITAQLEARRQEAWHALVRYDNAHGFCHRDTMHADGTQEKTALFVGDVNATFTYAIEDLKANWPAYYAQYLQEIKA